MPDFTYPNYKCKPLGILTFDENACINKMLHGLLIGKEHQNIQTHNISSIKCRKYRRWKISFCPSIYLAKKTILTVMDLEINQNYVRWGRKWNILAAKNDFSVTEEKSSWKIYFSLVRKKPI